MNRLSDPAQNAQREIVFVGGMSCSGASAFTRVCHRLGGALPQPFVEPASGDDFGRQEPAEVVAINDRALLSANHDVNDIAPLSSAWLRSKAAKSVVDEIEAYLARLGDAPQVWFINDPRISLLAGLWRAGAERIGVEPRFVIALRNPWEVAAAWSSQRLEDFPDEIWPLERGLALWLKSILAIEQKTRGLPRSFVSYDAFLADWSVEIQRIYSQLKLAQPALDDDVQSSVRKCLKPEQYHARQEIMQGRPMLAMHVYDLLLERLADPQGGKAALSKAAETFSISCNLLSGYVSALETRASQIRPLEARALDAEGAAEDLRRSLEVKDLKIIHLLRAAAPAEGGSDAGDDVPIGHVEIRIFERLQMKHNALKTAHRQNVEAYKDLESYKNQQNVWIKERDQLIEDYDRVVEYRNHLIEDRDRLIEDRDHLIEDRDDLIENQAKDVEEGRKAYEELRLEAASFRERLQSQIDNRQQVVRDELLADALADARSELALIHRSRSWRATSLLRSASRFFGRR